MTNFPQEIFSSICDYNKGTIYKKKFDTVVNNINLLKNDWVTDYWNYYHEDGVYEWALYGNYDMVIMI